MADDGASNGRKFAVTPTNGVLALAAVFGLGGGTGAVVTKGQVEAAISASEARIVGRLDLISAVVESAAKDTQRLASELAVERAGRERLLERVHAIEVRMAGASATSAGGGR